MRTTARILLALIGFVTCGAATAASATLLHQSINADIAISGEDDNGFYRLGVFNGPISVGAGFADDVSVFKRLTEEGFATPATLLPSAWTVMLLGFAGRGFFTYRKSNKDACTAALEAWINDT